jgi:hypothetical protein
VGLSNRRCWWYDVGKAVAWEEGQQTLVDILATGVVPLRSEVALMPKKKTEPKMEPVRREPVRRDPERDLNTFVADAVEFCCDGRYPQFLRDMANLGYSEAEVEELMDRVNKRAGRI